MKLKFKLFYFFFYFSIGILGPYLAVFLYQKDFSGGQIGLLMGAMPITSWIFQPLWSYLSDILNKRRILLLLGSLGLIVASLGLGMATTFISAFLFAILFSAMVAPINPIINAMMLDHLEEINQMNTYGKFRLWGSLGFAVSSILMAGFFLDQILLYFGWFLAGIYMILAGLSLVLPEEERPLVISEVKSLEIITQNPKFGIYLLASAFIGMTMGIYNNYQTLFFQSLDTSAWLIGIIISIQALVEVPMIMLAPYLLKKLSAQWMILVGAIALPLRWLLYTFIEEPLWVLPTQLLNGVAVVSFFVVGVTYTDKMIDPKWRATGQGLYSTALMGIGSGVGIFLAGGVLERYGVRSIWYLSFVLGMVGLLLLLLSFRRAEKQGQ